MKPNFDQLINNINDLGRSWANYGLTMGKAALETSASHLTNTANFLGDVSSKLKKEATTAETTTETTETIETK
jgi:hypothetical protein